MVFPRQFGSFWPTHLLYLEVYDLISGACLSVLMAAYGGKASYLHAPLSPHPPLTLTAPRKLSVRMPDIERRREIGKEEERVILHS